MLIISSNSKEIQINEEIRDKEVRVIDNDGTQLGVMSSKEALKLAEEKEFDLVKIAPQAEPPVCKIMDSANTSLSRASARKKPRKTRRSLK